jgi:hypothetical protein
MSRQAFAAALLLVVSGAAGAKDFRVNINGGASVAPIVNASEDTPVSYPGGAPPADIAGQFDADDSTFQRPALANFFTPSCAGTDTSAVTITKYDTVTITNTGTGQAEVTTEFLCGSNDTTAYLYSAFNPATPSVGCLQSNDDSGSPAGALCSVLNFSIPAGQTRVVVITPFSNAASGGADSFAYTVNFNGTTPVTLTNFSVD